jgi:hypothetical protein
MEQKHMSRRHREREFRGANTLWDKPEETELLDSTVELSYQPEQKSGLVGIRTVRERLIMIPQK